MNVLSYRKLFLLIGLMLSINIMAADTKVWLKHSSGMLAGRNSSTGRATLISSSSKDAVQLTLRDTGDGYFLIVHTDADGNETYLTLNGGWNTSFESDPTTDNAKYTIVGNRDELFTLKNKSNGKCLGSDSNDNGSNLYSDKSGTDPKHLWYIGETKTSAQPKLISSYIIAPRDLRQRNDGWGVSLCWWANMCGKWSDRNIDKLVDWMVSPDGLNYNIFRYNIGGGDDPHNQNCTVHHMGGGKGLRAEMEGFKTSSDAEYDWSADAAQRKILLKIKEKRPDAIFEAFSNSAPYYMTVSGCVSGNADGGKDNLRPECYEEFAHYLVDVCKHYKDEYGIEFATLAPFNEPNTSFWYKSGVQEGCHFDNASQIKFLKVLQPILAQSGLNTVISSSDESWVGTSIGTFRDYMNDSKALKLIGQWNTHTYSADNVSRSQIGTLSRKAGKPLWMSETGSGGTGIGGNLSMAKRLMDDVRYMLPLAWVDWQYMEENNDQWCTVRGSFNGQTYERVKNYYVRQQVTSHIKQGYTFVTSMNDNTLAAINPTRDTLVLVVINNSAVSATHNASIAGSMIGEGTQCYQTTESKNHSLTTRGFTVSGDLLTMQLPAQSISTFVMPLVGTTTQQHNDYLRDDVPYAILPQYNNEASLSSVGKQVTIDKHKSTNAVDANTASTGTAVLPSQSWRFVSDGTGRYGIYSESEGGWLTSTSGYALTITPSAITAKPSETFTIETVDGQFYKIQSVKTGKSLDLSNGAYTAGTQVGMWSYGTNPTDCHRNWRIVDVSLSADHPNSTAITDVHYDASRSASRGFYTLQGVRLQSPTTPGVYILNGRKVLVP